MTPMMKSEREDLQRLIRQREKVLKSKARERSAELLADFENQMGQEYAFDQDEIWKQATKAAEREVKKAEARVAARCGELGIPKQFAPSLHLSWHARGYENVLDKRRAELRRMAQTRAEAIERKAIVQIEAFCLDAQTQLARAGITSDAAQAFIEQLPSIEKLMPQLSFAAIAGEAEPPIAEQLVSPNALRQRRYRERQAALRNVPQALQGPSRNADGDAKADAPSGEMPDIPDFPQRDPAKQEGNSVLRGRARAARHPLAMNSKEQDR